MHIILIQMTKSQVFCKRVESKVGVSRTTGRRRSGMRAAVATLDFLSFFQFSFELSRIVSESLAVNSIAADGVTNSSYTDSTAMYHV